MICASRPGFVLCAAMAASSIGSYASHARGDELFVTDRTTDRILGFDPVTGAMTRVLAQLDPGSLPTSLTFGPGGDLYVGNLGTGKVQRINPVTGAMINDTFAQIGGVGGLAYDAGNIGDPDDDVLYVAEFGNFDGDEIYRFDADGAMIEPTDVIGTGSSATGRAGIALRDGDVYVSSFGSGEFFLGSVLKYDDADGFETETTIAMDFTPPGTLNGANGLAFDAAGNLYVAGLISQGVMKFDISGGPDFDGTPFGFPIPYASSVLVTEEDETEAIYVTSLGNDNPSDPIYGGFLFPGAIYKFDAATGNLIGAGPFVASGGDSDHNDDGDVDGADLVVWEEEFGASNDADADSDGDSDGADFLTWQRNVGNLGDFQPTAIVLYPTQVANSPVPEPASVALSAVTAAFVFGLRRRR